MTLWEELGEKETEFWWNDGKRSGISHRKDEVVKAFRRNRPFIAWDGEGITYPGNPQQAYVLFAASTGEYIRAREGYSLNTEECLSMLFSVERRIPHAYHVGFGFGYDTNQILNSLSRGNIYGLTQAVRQGRSYKWNGYRIRIHPGKLFRVSRGVGDDFQCVTVYDTFSFFQKRFIDVVRTFFPDRINEIESGKSNRATFKYSEIESITKYCLAENALLVGIMDQLRENLEERGLYLRDWHGPGAIASASLKKHGIKYCKGEVPKDVERASRLAYQGGRFELLRAGYSKQRIWQYDINSAYPSAIVGLPDLSKGSWEFRKEFEPGTFAVWHIIYSDLRNDRYDRYSRYRAEPFFYRTADGRVAYSPQVEGWYWTPEVENLLLIDYPAKIEIIEGWIYRGDDSKPFAYVQDIYDERLQLKKQGNGLEKALKLEINSYYGKFAQRSGWFQPGDRIPSYHQLEWAGYITSSTRSKLWKVYNQSPGSIFSFETDAIFSTRPLELDCGEKLGQWTKTEYEDILYIQSGFYFAHSDGKEIAHYRGFDKGALNFEDTYRWLDSLNPNNTFSSSQPKLSGPSKRFIGFKRALLSRNPRYWRTWDISTREITIGRDGKRIHMPGCPLCISGHKWTDGLHGLTCQLAGGFSHPHKIPWEEDLWIENQWGEEKLLDNCDGFDT